MADVGSVSSGDCLVGCVYVCVCACMVGKSSSQLSVHETVYSCIFVHYCIIFHKPTFAHLCVCTLGCKL